MVNLTMRVGETLAIGQKLALTVLGIDGNQVRIDIAAEEDIPLNREADLRRRQGNNSGQPADTSIPLTKSTKIP